jgi:hypothetical protein
MYQYRWSLHEPEILIFIIYAVKHHVHKDPQEIIILVMYVYMEKELQQMLPVSQTTQIYALEHKLN